MIRHATIGLLIAAAVGCSSNSNTGGVCGEAEEYRDGGDLFCIIRNPVLIEEGFVCPDEAPRMIETEDGGICAPPDREQDAEEVYERFLADKEQEFLNNGQPHDGPDAGGFDMRGEVVDFGLPPADMCTAAPTCPDGQQRVTSCPPDGACSEVSRCGVTILCLEGFDAPRCIDVPVENCADWSHCEPQTGRRFDAANQCYEASVPATCLPRDAGCSEAESNSIDPDGDCWHFNSICELPEGWSQSTPSGTDCPYVDDVPDCP